MGVPLSEILISRFTVSLVEWIKSINALIYD